MIIFRLFYRIIGFICISCLSLIGNNSYEEKIVIESKIYDKAEPVISTVVEYDTIIKYNNKLPSDKRNVLVEGKNGLNYQDKSGNSEVLTETVSEVIEVGTGANSTYTGKTTGYGADCLGCSGIVACKTREGTYYNLAQEGEYYYDNQYGKVRILAANLSMFKCGTVIEIDNGSLEPFLGIVLDTGSGMRNSWNNYGIVHFDIAHVTETNPVVYQATSRNANFNVQRWGW